MDIVFNVLLGLGITAVTAFFAVGVGKSIGKLIKGLIESNIGLFIKDKDMQIWFLQGVALAQKQIGHGRHKAKRDFVKRWLMKKTPKQADEFISKAFDSMWDELMEPIKKA